MSKTEIVTAEKIEKFITSNTPISKEAIALARYNYKYFYAHEPEILRMHSSSYRDLMTKTDAGHYDLMLYMGLTIQHDENLEETEWRVGRSHEVFKKERLS